MKTGVAAAALGHAATVDEPMDFFGFHAEAAADLVSGDFHGV